MPKFSIIIPVYNVEEYIKKCLDSVFNQTEKDFEVIVVNDGTKDKSMDIVKNYQVKIINQKNQGLSAARNKGVEEAKGEYLIFLDSDDYLEKNLLREIKKSLKNTPDLVRFQIKETYPDKEIKYEERAFTGLNGERAFTKISSYHFVENAWCYAIKKSYYLKENFTFKKDTIHEDFGLIPLVIIKAKIVNSISYIGYNYVQRTGSIMSSKNYEKTQKKVQDFYNHYHFLLTEIDKTNLDSTYFKSFISNSLILKITELKFKDYHHYLKLLRKDQVFENLLIDTKKRRIKKSLLKISPKFYYKIMK
ncbi:MAG: glycosyltransferase [bacterium]|nr:glycosyltransferase [bacterium]